MVEVVGLGEMDRLEMVFSFIPTEQALLQLALNDVCESIIVQVVSE